MKKILSVFTIAILLLTPLSAYCEETLTEPGPDVPVDEPVARYTTIYTGVPVVSVCNESNGVRIGWSRIPDTEGYLIYKQTGEDIWDEIGEYNDTRSIYYLDNSVETGASVTYKVLAYNNVTVDYEEETADEYPDQTGNDGTASYVFLKPPTGISVTREGTSMTVTWDESVNATGYTVECSRNSMFKGVRRKTVSKTQVTFDGLKADKKYYIRVKARNRTDGLLSISYWSHSKNVRGSKKASASYVRNRDNKRLDVREASNQKLYGYDTIQGSTSDGTYTYTILLNKSKNRCRIIKMMPGSDKVIKVSGVLNLGHGNDMAYDPDTNRLVVAHGASTKRTISVIDPKTLKRAGRIKITIPDEISGVSLSKLKKKPYFGGISYIPMTGEYALKATYCNMILYLDSDFVPVRAVNLSTSPNNLNQNTHVTEDYIYRVTSPGKKAGNIIYSYDRCGIYLGNIKIPVLGELEGIYFVGNKLYASVYRSRYITVTKKITKHYYKYKKVKGKKKKIRKKKVIIKKYRKFYRDSYVIRIRDF